MSNPTEDNTVLLFFDNFEYQKVQYNIEEIFFNKAIILHQIRILKQDSNPHTKLKSMSSITQKDIIYNFEIFGRNLKRLNANFEILYPCSNINTDNGETDCIFPFRKEFVTNHIVIRGKFEKITMCIYGKVYDEIDKSLIIENAKSDVPLEKLDEIISNKKHYDEFEINKIPFDELEFAKLYSIESLTQNYSYIKNNVKNYEINRVYNLNKPNMNMIERTKNGYIYYENDMHASVQNLYDFYLTKDTLNDERVVQHQKSYKLLFDILKILIRRNFAYLEMDCVFRNENFEIFSNIPVEISDKIINIISNSLNGYIYGYTEIKFGLKLLKFISNSQLLVDKFVNNYGMEKIYKIILINNENQFNNNLKENTNSSLLIKALSLENIYKLITFKNAFERLFESIDSKKFPKQYFLIKESTKEVINENNENKKEKEKEKGKEKERKKEKEKERSRSKSKDHKSKHSKKKHKDKKSKSKSSSKSSNSRERNRNKDNRDSSNDSHSAKKYKKKNKNVLLKNGYQIINTLLISKRNILLQNIIKHIINKINLMLYLRNLNNLITKNIILKDNTENTIIKIDFTKVIYTLQSIFDLIKKIEIPCEKKLENENYLDQDYPYKYYWIDYIKTNRKFYEKNLMNEEDNLQSILRNETSSFNSIFKFGEITNEICQILEQYNLLENLTILLMNEQIQSLPQFFEIGIVIKNFISYIILSRGGINFFSKNYNQTQNFLQVIKKISSPLEDKIDEKSFFKVELKTIKGFNEILLNKSLYENNKYDKINDVLINCSCNKIEFTEEYILQLHFLQLKYLIQYSFYFLNLYDKYNGILDNDDESIEQSDINDKTLDIILQFENSFKKSNISEQAFLSFCNNDYFFNGLIETINKYIQSEENISEYEGHITALTNLLFMIFTSLDNNSDIFLLLYGKTILNSIIQLKKKIVTVYDMKDLELINANLFNDLDVLISLLKPIENKDIKSLMTIINDSIFNNIMKYNLNKKVIKIDKIDEKLKEYLDGFKLNIQNYQNRVEDFLEELKVKGSLINDIFSAVKILNLSVIIYIFLIYFYLTYYRLELILCY